MTDVTQGYQDESDRMADRDEILLLVWGSVALEMSRNVSDDLGPAEGKFWWSGKHFPLRTALLES